MIVGIDEVGRGPWAGPLVVCAVVLGEAKIEGLTDSKKLSAKRRTQLADEIYRSASGIGLGWVHADELDEIGISRSLIEATKRALEQITVPYHEIIIDGTVNFLAGTGKGPFVTTMKKADLLIASVSAASIVAKVARDKFMEEQATLYPEYGFESHVGYGTAKHIAAIEKHGVTPLHRLSFAPLAKYQSKSQEDAQGKTGVRTTKSIGNHAETIAANYLQANEYEVLERNWKTKICEIDIVARKNTTVYFVEVKHRKDNLAGGGIAAITPKKLEQMTFAARVYAKAHQLDRTDLRLAVVTTINDPPVVESFILLE